MFSARVNNEPILLPAPERIENKKIKNAVETFMGHYNALHTCMRELQKAEDFQRNASVVDDQANAADIMAGREVEDPSQYQREADEAVRRFEKMRDAHNIAVSKSYIELRAVISANADKWSATLKASVNDAVERLAGARKMMLDATADYEASAGFLEMLAKVNAGGYLSARGVVGIGELQMASGALLDGLGKAQNRLGDL